MTIHSAQISLYTQLPALNHKATGYASSITHTVIASFHIKLVLIHTQKWLCAIINSTNVKFSFHHIVKCMEKEKKNWERGIFIAIHSLIRIKTKAHVSIVCVCNMP